MSWLIEVVQSLSSDPIYELVLRIVAIQVGAVVAILILALSSRVVRNRLREQRIRRVAWTSPMLRAYVAGDRRLNSVALVFGVLPRSGVRELVVDALRIATGRGLIRLIDLYLELSLYQRDEVHIRSIWWWRRAVAARRLGWLRHDRFRDVLARALTDRNRIVRIEAAKGLGHLGDARAIEAVCDMVVAPNRWQTVLLRDLAGAVGEPGRAVLREQVEDDPRPAVRATAMDALRLLEDRGALAVIAPLLESPDVELRVRAVRAVGVLGGNDHTARLMERLSDPRWEVRAQAVSALSSLGPDKKSAEAIAHALTDKAWWVRFNAARALAEAGDEGLALLRRARATSGDAFARDMATRTLERLALGRGVELATEAST